MGSAIPLDHIILFDGVCNLCNASVRFVMKRDTKKKFRFASLQSEFAKKIISTQVAERMKTIVLVKGDRMHLRSDAALEICKELSGLWPSLYILKIIPRFARDVVYDFISRHRYRWFGKTEECWLPTADMNVRFVD